MKRKICFKCNVEKELSDYYKHPEMPDGHVNKCKECNKIDVQENYKKNRSYYNDYDKRRNRAEHRLIAHKYKGIVTRCNWTGSKRSYTVKGMKYLTYGSFLKWWKAHKPKYQEIYNQWEESGFNRKLAPSIDRINNRKGYTPKNMQWLTLTENCIKHTK